MGMEGSYSTDVGSFATDSDVFNARYQIATPQPQSFSEEQSDGSTIDRAELIWKGSQSTTYVTAPPPATMGFTVTWEEDKSRRETEKVKVTNKDDESQFIELERIKNMTIKNNITGEEIPIKMDWGD
jgi:hypothetical protein